MNLFTEINENVELITEENKDGEKTLFIKGVFLQGGIKNRNGRVYPVNVLDNEVNRYIKESINKNRSYGELGHPQGPQINLERISHMITELKKDGNNYIGKAKIMDTPFGNIAKNLLKGGANLGVSSRGLGTLRKNNDGINEVQDDFKLATAADIVADPSAPDAYVNAIMENQGWVFDAASNSWASEQILEDTSKTAKRSVKELNEKKLELFQRFIESL